jgi:hypothetical protein
MDDQTPGAVEAPLEAPVRPHAALVESLRANSYALPSQGDWIERNGDTLPNNVCTEAADEIERLCAALMRLLDGSQHCGEMQWCGEEDESPWEAARVALGPNVRAEAAPRP